MDVAVQTESSWFSSLDTPSSSSASSSIESLVISKPEIVAAEPASLKIQAEAVLSTPPTIVPGGDFEDSSVLVLGRPPGVALRAAPSTAPVKSVPKPSVPPGFNLKFYLFFILF